MPTAYELEREANIARNRALLDELDLKDAVAQLGVPAKPPPAPAKGRARPIQPAARGEKRKAEAPPEPRRQSARLRGSVVDPNETPKERRRREKEEAERQAKEAEEQLLAEDAARAAKRPRHYDLDLTLLAEESGHAEELPSLRRVLGEITREARPRAIGDRDAFVFEDDGEKEETELADLRQRMQGLKVVARAKVTKDRIYSAAYHPEPTKDLIFFGDKHGQLGIWDARAPPDEVGEEEEDERPQEEREGGKYWQLQVHWPATSKSSISSIKLDPADSHSLYTSSYDCTIRHLSFVSGVSREVFATNEELITSVDLVPTGREMWVADSVGGLTHLDLRQPRSRTAWYGLSDQKIGCVSVNPVSPHLLLTASNSKALKIWDARKLHAIGNGLNSAAAILTPPPSSPTGTTAAQQSPDVGEPLEFSADVVEKFASSKKGTGVLRGEWTHGKSVSAAYWDPRGRSVVSTSYDDKLRLWDYKPSDLEKSGKTLPSSRPFSMFSHNCQTGKWLTVLKAQWTPNTNIYPHFTIGNMNHSLDVISCKGDLVARLADKSKITAVQAVTASHPSIVERAVSGNGSGRCVLWAPADKD